MRLYMVVLLAGLYAILISADAYQTRRLYTRGIQDATSTQCSNTVQGMAYMTDSRGFVCLRDDVDYRTGCCKKGVQYACDRCNLQDKCCSEYEHCVSCCLAPQHDANQLAKTAPRSVKHTASGTWNNPFDYCRGVCRTHGSSTVHENAYISTQHHCFSKLGRPMLSDPLPPGALDKIQVVLSDAGETCDMACTKLSKQCSAQHLRFLNTCDRLRERVGCEAGCEMSKALAGVPGYVEASAPKANRPAMCFVAAGPAEPGLACNGQEAHVKRLCPCA